VRQVVIPNVMGLVLYQPQLSSSTGVSPRSEWLCRELVHRFLFNVFDQAASRDGVNGVPADVASASGGGGVRQADGSDARFFRLCTAAGSGDADLVAQLLSEGANPRLRDYDARTPLHIAASEGHAAVCRLLIDAGADPRARDRCASLVSCPVPSCPVLSCPVLSCPVLSCRARSCPVVSCRVLSCPVVSCRVLSCPVVSCRVL
jgi:hypothetical protein